MIIENRKLEPIIQQDLCSQHGIFSSQSFNNENWSSCPKCRTESEQYERYLTNEKQIAINKANKVNQMFNNSCIPPRFRECSFDNYNITNTKQSPIVDKLKEYGNGFVRHNTKDLILLGKIGTGKTHLANAIANHLIKNEFTAVYTTLFTIIDKLYEAGFDKHTELSKYIEPDFLIIDEIFAKVNEDTLLNLFKIIDGRYQQMRPTCLISNISLLDLHKVLGERISDRILTDVIILEFGWKSNRVKSK